VIVGNCLANHPESLGPIRRYVRPPTELRSTCMEYGVDMDTRVRRSWFWNGMLVLIPLGSMPVPTAPVLPTLAL
jgi:hypothetical protein